MDKPSINKEIENQSLQISEEDITTALDQLKKFSCPGKNAIGTEIWANLPNLNREIFFFIISKAWENNWIPDQWRYSVITIIYQKLLHHMEKIGKIEPTQFGFQKNLDIAQAITSLILTMEESNLNKNDLYLCYLDFFKAYDSVEIDMLLRTLKYYKVPLLDAQRR